MSPKTHHPLSPPSAFWALLPIALTTATQPAGMVCSFPSAHSFALRSSPLICLLDALDVAVRFLLYALQARSLKHGAERVCRRRFADIADQREEGSLASLRKNMVLRWCLFGLGALPQAVELWAARGLMWTNVWSGMFVGEFVVAEAVVLLGGRGWRGAAKGWDEEETLRADWWLRALSLGSGVATVVFFLGMLWWSFDGLEHGLWVFGCFVANIVLSYVMPPVGEVHCFEEAKVPYLVMMASFILLTGAMIAANTSRIPDCLTPPSLAVRDMEIYGATGEVLLIVFLSEWRALNKVLRIGVHGCEGVGLIHKVYFVSLHLVAALGYFAVVFDSKETEKAW
ncbi:hypothetical protein MMC13_002239 [Lambiella insularis]|nr:hypothetical protein [Lambiella insularis]